MNISSLEHFRLEACRFSRSSCSFEFDGELAGQKRRFIVSTAYSVSVAGEPLADAGEMLSEKIWPFLETDVKTIVSEERLTLVTVTFLFDEGRGFVIWANKPLMDNLLLVRDVDTGDWFPVS